MRVENMTSANGNKVANQFIIYSPECTVFQSYNSVIAKKMFDDGKRITILDSEKWDYSKTTGKYRNQFLGESKKETERKIESGEYRLENLNP